MLARQFRDSPTGRISPGEDTLAVAALTCSVPWMPVAPPKAYSTFACGVTTCTWVLDGNVTASVSSRCWAYAVRLGAAVVKADPGHVGMLGSTARCPGTA